MPGDPEFHPTSYPEVNTVLALLLSEVRALVGEELLGMYLNGSLSLGAFELGSSDIDFLVATVNALADEQVSALSDMHARLLTSGLSYATRLEGFYLPQAALRRSDPATTRYPFSAQAEGLLLVELGSDWVIQRHLVRETAIVLWGPPPQTLLGAVLPGELRVAVIEQVTGYWKQQLEHPECLRPREEQAFAILTMCRALYTLVCGEVVSKPRAAAWAREALGAPWAQLIDRALLWRYDSRADDMTDMLNFVRYTIARCQEEAQA
jgi:Aminoglycoside adenylyltransferase, C-terminal domain